MLLPSDGGSGVDGDGDGAYLAARRELLREAQQGTDRAEGIGGGIVLDVVLGRQMILVSDCIVNVGDSLIDIGDRVRPLDYGIVAEIIRGRGVGDLRAREE